MAKFSVAARTLIHLGAELITSDEVAINELVKNAFDAESPRVKISFHVPVPQTVLMGAVSTLKHASTKAEIAAVVVRTSEDVRSAIDLLPEGVVREDAEHQLARLRKCTTVGSAKAAIESFNHITIEDSGHGMDSDALESVFLMIGTASKLELEHSKTLHRVVLGNKGIGRLAMMRLGDRASVTSWAVDEGAHSIDFNWQLFEDPKKTIDQITLDVRSVDAPRATASGTVIRVTALKSQWSESLVRTKLVGAFLRRLQNPFVKSDKTSKNLSPAFPIDVHFNGGARIPIEGMNKLLTDFAQADMELTFDASKCKKPTDGVLRTDLVDHQRGGDPIRVVRTAADVCLVTGATVDELKDIGPFQAKIRWFNRDRLRQQATLHGNWKVAKNELDLWSGGIAIYRDGFRIGFSGQSTGEDWLELDSSALRRGGFTVNRIQVVGALEITRADNPELIDRSNREGLIESRQADLVRALLVTFAIAELRRHIDHEGRAEKQAVLDEVFDSAPAVIRQRVVQAEQGLSEIRAKVPADAKETVRSIATHLHFIKGEVKRFEQATKQSSERREDILELAGVGTVMAGVLHELTRTTGHTRQLLQKLSKGENPGTKALLAKLEAEIKAINTRLRQLDPLTPSGRHRKEEFDLVALLGTIVEGYAARFERHEIDCDLSVSGLMELQPVPIKMVRGFVSLAIENLITNSVYWLQHGIREGETRRRITLEIDPVSRTLTFRDNGPGISPADKARVFTAGFSLRPRGHGLGLFIAAEVATYHDAKLVLDSADEDGRYRGFVLELPTG